MAPSTRISQRDQDDQFNSGSEPSLTDIMAEIKKISALQKKQINDITSINVRIDKIDEVVEKLSNDIKILDNGDSKETKHYDFTDVEELNPKTENDAMRSPLTVPGLKSTWNPKKSPFRAPHMSPGPRGKTNLLCLSDPNVDRKARKSWTLYNKKSEYIQWLWKFWCELVVESDLDQSTLDVRNSNKPFRPGLKPLTNTNDVENLMHLQEIQSALVQEGTYYHLWPQRVCHLFKDDFKQVNAFCKTHRPTWPMRIEAILQILALSNHLRSPIDAFVNFRSGPLENESTAQFLRRFELAFHRMPTRERCEREVEFTIEYTLQTHAGMVWNTLIQQEEAYPLHNALSIAWTTAEKQQSWMAQLSA